jgi:leucyl aminopeptidase
MDFRFRALPAGGLAAVPGDALLVLLVGDALPAGLEPPLQTALQAAVKDGDLALKAGRSLYLHRVAGLKTPRVAVAVAGDGSAKAMKSAAAAGLVPVKGLGVTELAVVVLGGTAAEATPEQAEALVAAAQDAAYGYRATKPSAAPAPKLARVTLYGAKAQAAALQAALDRGAAVAAGVAFARDCGNRPPNVATPTWLAEQAEALAKAHGFKCEVLDRKDCEKLGMGAFLGVARGSDEPPKFIVLRHQGGAKADAPLVLVGKGITFDSGGISLKPGADMDEMKFDMSGAASVLGVFRALGELKPKLNVVGLIPACENMPSGRALKPGDVLTSMAGTTIEILNTDAEGRLILCDALTYAERFKPRAVVDIATLTGACVIALGGVHSGLFTADDALAQALQSAGQRALDTCWRLPLDEEYDEGLKSNFADVANVGGRAGGAITAAMFLKRFAKAYPWAHLDIAGTAWKSGAAKGSTGRPVPLLVNWVLSQAA